uniref:Rho GDP-dissociation inhibitor 1 n=1 Tax=Theropithecus gelada TaxID=9565 RepID=A0A8D2F014_THEGE
MSTRSTTSPRPRRASRRSRSWTRTTRACESTRRPCWAAWPFRQVSLGCGSPVTTRALQLSCRSPAAASTGGGEALTSCHSPDPNVPNVVVTGLTLVCSSAPGPLELDLTGDLESFKKQSFVLKEGVEYRIKISFRVNREIVSGMKYIQHTYRKGVKIDKTDYMVGSYSIKSRFTDDDKTDHLSWEWNLTIKKDWKD